MDAARPIIEARLRDVRRWFDPHLPVTWEYGHYKHFCSPRGFGVTFCHESPRRCVMRYSRKLQGAPAERIEGVVRHEMGHVLDWLYEPDSLDELARINGLTLARTQERRADDIARLVWGTPIFYDHLDVQAVPLRRREGGRSNPQRKWKWPRPTYLGL